jgi:hypothetical protein
VLVLAVLATACARIEVGARPPAQPTGVTQDIAGSAVVDVSEVPHGQYCAHAHGQKELCITDLRVAFEYGLKSVTESFFEGEGPRYTVTFRMLELSHVPVSLTSPGERSLSHVTMQWQLLLKDNRGKVVMAVSDTTRSPKQIYYERDADEAVQRLVEVTLADVVAILNTFGAEH